MAETTGIAWTDSTFNPWIGCQAISPGCKNCYAEAYAKRVGRDFATRTRTSAENWIKPLKWQRHAENGLLPDGKTPRGGRSPRVFCASLADVFDNKVPTEWRHDLFNLIWETPALTWLLLTKRIGNARHMLPLTTLRNAWIGATIVNQEEADRDVPKLLETPAAKRFVSYEPALGPVDWTKFPGIDWIIVGGESTQGGVAREFNIDFALRTIHQCRKIGAAPFVKQLGAKPQEISQPNSVTDAEAKQWQQLGWTRIWAPHEHWRKYYHLKDRAGANPSEWPEDLRVQEFPA